MFFTFLKEFRVQETRISEIDSYLFYAYYYYYYIHGYSCLISAIQGMWTMIKLASIIKPPNKKKSPNEMSQVSQIRPDLTVILIY